MLPFNPTNIFNQYPYINLTDLNEDYILNYIKWLVDHVKDLDEWRVKYQAEYDALIQFYKDLMDGKLTAGMISAINKWCSENIVNIVGEMVHQVFFNITDDGYFVAFVPESWNDILFGTSGLDDFPVGIDYGHLTLSY